MENKKTRNTVIIAMLLLLLCGATIGGTIAYFQNTTEVVENTFVAVAGGKVFEPEDPSNINECFVLDESKAIPQDDGNYELDTSSRTKTNEYKIMENMTIKKDPTITIKDKTEIPMYLYVEVKNNLKDYISYAINTGFVKIDGLTGKNDGDVYVLGTLQTIEETPTLIPTIIKAVNNEGVKYHVFLNDQVIVNNSDLSLLPKTNNTIDIYAYLAQSSIGDAKTTYETCFKN